jgi:hypothetical protein
MAQQIQLKNLVSLKKSPFAGLILATFIIICLCVGDLLAGDSSLLQNDGGGRRSVFVFWTLLVLLLYFVQFIMWVLRSLKK